VEQWSTEEAEQRRREEGIFHLFRLESLPLCRRVSFLSWQARSESEIFQSAIFLKHPTIQESTEWRHSLSKWCNGRAYISIKNKGPIFVSHVVPRCWLGSSWTRWWSTLSQYKMLLLLTFGGSLWAMKHDEPVKKWCNQDPSASCIIEGSAHGWKLLPWRTTVPWWIASSPRLVFQHLSVTRTGQTQSRENAMLLVWSTVTALDEVLLWWDRLARD
jgi:hypothetical protein